MIQPTTFNLTTIVLFCLTVWVIVVRYRTKLESNWPLFYYLALAGYATKFDETIHPMALIVAAAMALLLRFEFLGGWVVKAVQCVETAALLYVLWRCLQLVLG